MEIKEREDSAPAQYSHTFLDPVQIRFIVVSRRRFHSGMKHAQAHHVPTGIRHQLRIDFLKTRRGRSVRRKLIDQINAMEQPHPPGRIYNELSGMVKGKFREVRLSVGLTRVKCRKS